MDSMNVVIFKTISNFVFDLSSFYGKKQRSLLLYKRLIEKTTLVHETTINKHIELFKKFCISNREAIQNQDHTKLADNFITYSEKVFIDMKNIFELADNESKNVIWKHLLTITAFVDPSSNAKKLLKEMSEDSKSKGESGNEANFLSNIIEKVEKNIDPEEASKNPMAAVSSIMSSGVFTDLISNMQSGIEKGDLDLGKLMGTVQGMLGSMGGNTGMDLSSLMSNLGGLGQK
jgi:hypothetical protein